MGLLVAMVQSGLHIPASRESLLPVFTRIRADIGDEQNIVQSLSTFSGHMKNIIEIVGEADPETLVLLDELGSGTDPSEGAALAKAVLASLIGSGALTVATTHINELKIFAHQQEGMENASMEFDQGPFLLPTAFCGVPGRAMLWRWRKSWAAAPGDGAGPGYWPDHTAVESVIASLVEDQRRMSRDSRLASQERARARALLEQVERERGYSLAAPGNT